MKKLAVTFLILTGLLNKVMIGLNGLIIHVNEMKTWFEAQNYCRKYHTDLHSHFFEKNAEAIGCPNSHDLYRDTSNTWKWSEGNGASVVNWSAPLENPSCVAVTQNKWCEMDCYEKLSFDCFQTNLVLVKENKTWEEALEHCRSKKKNWVSPSNVVPWILRDSQTEYVWIGLRYLAGRWMTMRKTIRPEPRGVRMMPECPAWGHNCGAISTTDKKWVSWDCAAKLNFIC